jgi:hypothetical protein
VFESNLDPVKRMLNLGANLAFQLLYLVNQLAFSSPAISVFATCTAGGSASFCWKIGRWRMTIAWFWTKSGTDGLFYQKGAERVGLFSVSCR